LLPLQDSTDTFEDIPLDTRHHKVQAKPKFPKEWYLTEERVQQLENHRQNALLLDQAKEDAGSLVDGAQVIEMHFKKPELVAIPAQARGPSLSPGRQNPSKQRRVA
jgi:small subunit ribosomal protein S35